MALHNSLIFSRNLNTKMLRSLTMLWWIWLWPSSGFSSYAAKHSLEENNAAWEVYWLFIETSHLNWMIQLSESAKWFKCRNKRMLWRSSNLETGKSSPKSNKNSAETVFCSHSSLSALPLAKQVNWFSGSTKFSGFAGSTKQAETWPQNLAWKAASFCHKQSN